MQYLNEFIERYAFCEMSGQYYGMYNDMHMALLKENEGYTAYLYLDLPPAGRKERRDLIAEMNARGARFDISVNDQQEKKGFLRIAVPEDRYASSSLDRFLTECDILLRPYGREMGLLCAYCRKEMREETPVYKMENGIVVPVCPACAGLESASRAKKGDNRKTIEKKRTLKGIVGAAIGCLISMVMWGLTGGGRGILMSIICAFASVALIKWLFEKMSKVPNRLKSVAILALALFALIVGSSVRYTKDVNDYNRYWRDWGASMQITNEAGILDPAYEEDLMDVNMGVYDDQTLIDTFGDIEYYKGLAIPVAAVIFASFGSDAVSFKPRKRR